MTSLREASVADAQLVYRAWGRYAENFERLTARPFENLGDAQRYLDQLFASSGSCALHVLCGDLVVGLVKAVVVGHRAQVGYVIDRRFWGQGLATGAVRELVSRLEQRAGIQRIWATCALDNPASVRVLEKCGFEREGVLRNWVIYPALGADSVDNYSYVYAGTDAARDGGSAG